ncbi:MAG: acyl-CoA dehydrogenase family protein [Candidatus Eremiobacteraeota bacterium]|nr:acyl-CoA dehydrogenase family protein [Candidatus Eremiobacteraeota bacterium]MBV8281513.1 acyl-CoA dehydrogenase family protein [Candidatus Eremiobacteraeota bacterium]
MNFELPEDLKLLRRSIREFVEKELWPVGQQVEDTDQIPQATLDKMKEVGLFGLPFPEEYGGADVGELGYCVALEELGRANAAFSNVIGAHCSIGAMALHLDGSKELKDKYMPRLCTGELIACFALSEPNAGSDAANIQTSAVRQGDAYVVNGVKHFITNGDFADFATVFTVTDRNLGARGGITALWVDLNQPGVKRGPNDKKMGLYGSHTCELIFNDAKVPADHVIGQVGLGFITAMRTLDMGRLSLGAGCVGASQFGLEKAIAHAKERIQFGKPIAKQQAVQFMLADIATEIYAARNMVYNGAWKADRGERFSMEAAMVKRYCSDMAIHVVDRVLQIFGGSGFMKETGIERGYRDARILAIYEGTNEIQRMIIAEELIK